METNSALLFGRILMGDTLAFHILFALLGVGIPLMVSLAELIGILRKDSDYTLMAQRWSFAMSALFVVGALSGTIVAFELGVLWPKFMEVAGKVIGLPMYMETYAFFIEAIFLGIYLFTWQRLSPWVHWLCSLPIVIGGTASAFFITTANAFMQNPQGFDIVNGEITNVNPLKAMFNPAMPTEVSHSILAYYVTTALLIGGIYAYALLRNKFASDLSKRVAQKALMFTMVAGLVFALLVGLTGDRSGKYIAKHEPLKLAAAERLEKTQKGAPLDVFGIKIPYVLSILAFNDPHAEVKGLDAFPEAEHPPLFIHINFISMAMIGGLLVVIPLAYIVMNFFKKKYAWCAKYMHSKVMLGAIIISGYLGIIAVEMGWILTEVGRQPYIIRGVMLVKDAFTTSEHVILFAWIFPVLFLILFIATIWILTAHYRRNPLKAISNEVSTDH